MVTIDTIHGSIDRALITEVREVVREDNKDRRIVATEYYVGPDIVRVDIHVTIKKMPELTGGIMPHKGVPNGH